MSKRILVVEDNPMNRRVVRKILLLGGYEVIESEDGLTGVDTAIREKPDLILMDINLPDIDGLEAMRRIKAHANTQHVPVVALTANAMHGDRERFLNAGCDGYISKPIITIELLNKISVFLTDTVLS